jgi:sugar lactone lactonase YvrE
MAFRGFTPHPVSLIPAGGRGPEDVVVLPDGDLVTGVEDGRVRRIGPGGGRTIADTGGRPLGVEQLPDGGLVVCDAHRGLLRLEPGTGQLSTLVDATEIGLCDNAAVAADGTIYFTGSSRRHDLDHYSSDVIEYVGTGRVLRRSPGGRVDVLHRGLRFANGVALSADGSFLVVAESGARSLTRIRLDEPGRADVFAGDLPGYPDNVSNGPDGTFWVAFPRPRSRILDVVQRAPLAARRGLARVAQPWAGAPARRTAVLGLSPAGEAVARITVRSGRYRSITGVRATDRRLYLGSLTEDRIAVVDLFHPREDRR